MSKPSIPQGHSPGEWTVYGGDLYAQDGDVHRLVARFPWRSDVGLEERVANLALCAAAPDMLAALESALGWMEFCLLDGEADTKREIYDAIAKARGQAS